VTAGRILAVAAILLALTACEEDRECLDYDTRTVSSVRIVNGKAVPSTQVVTVCTQYAEASR
jgi:hypothetical protein